MDDGLGQHHAFVQTEDESHRSGGVSEGWEPSTGQWLGKTLENKIANCTPESQMDCQVFICVTPRNDQRSQDTEDRNCPDWMPSPHHLKSCWPCFCLRSCYCDIQSTQASTSFLQREPPVSIIVVGVITTLWAQHGQIFPSNVEESLPALGKPGSKGTRASRYMPSFSPAQTGDSEAKFRTSQAIPREVVPR